MKKKMSVLAILSVAVLWGFTACGGPGTAGSTGLPESAITVQNAPPGHLSVLVSSVNTVPVTHQQLISAIQSGAAVNAPGGGTSPVPVMWRHGIQTGQRLVIVTAGTEQRFGLSNIASDGNGTVNWSTMSDATGLPLD